MGAGIAAGQHAEDDAEGDAVEAGADQIVIAQDKQAVDAHVHQERRLAVGSREAAGVFRVCHQVPIVPGFAAHGEGRNHQNAEHNAAEHVHRQPGGHLQ